MYDKIKCRNEGDIMLKLFEVSGFKNFKDKLTIDFSDVRDYKFNNQCVSNGLLSKVIVYGKNSVGKTNLGLAIFDIVSHLTTGDADLNLYKYYLNGEDRAEDVASFRYQFDFSGSIIDYQYEKDYKRRLFNERLYLDGELLFDYCSPFHRFKYNDGLKNLVPTLNLEYIDSNSLLKYVMNNSSLSKDHPLRKMMIYVSNMLWFRSLNENQYIGYKNKNDDYHDFIFKGNALHEFEAFLNKTGVNKRLIAKRDADGVKRLYFDTKRPLPFFVTASSGTKALYTFFYWYKTAKDVSLMFIDEFDAFYHFELAETIVSLLEKMNNTQVILTSHNTNLLSNKIMRPDCYFIMTDGKITSFANATTRELREGHNLEKLYMSGEFNE